MALRYARWTLAAAVLAWAGVACSSSEGPSGPAATPDTTGILATVTAAESAFTSDPYSSFGVVLNGGVVASLTPRRTAGFARRSEERRVGKECRSRWSTHH